MKKLNVAILGLFALAAIYSLNNSMSYADYDNSGPAMSEGELRAAYYGADRKIMQCANGSSECSSERVEDLKAARDAAQDGLSLHYNYKYVDGVYIKDPGN